MHILWQALYMHDRVTWHLEGHKIFDQLIETYFPPNNNLKYNKQYLGGNSIVCIVLYCIVQINSK